MAGLQELQAAIDHITACTGDREAWRRGLTVDDLAAASGSLIDPTAATALLTKIRANHPELFDGAPTPIGHAGVAADAMKDAEEALARQNSLTAEVDLHVVAAIAGAHSDSEQGSEQLQSLQRDIENALRVRTDLDTPAGAREFQRYLIGKLREIGAVVETASLDGASKAALTSAWTALYRSSEHADPVEPQSVSLPAGRPEPAGAEEVALPSYGVNSTEFDPAPSGYSLGPVTPAPGVPPPAPVVAPAQTMPMSGFAPAMPSAALPPMTLNRLPHNIDRMEYEPDTEIPEEPPADDVEPASPEIADQPEEPERAPDPGAAVRVALPDGSAVNAPSPVLAAVMRAALAGTPLPEAFRAQGIAIPAPGSAVGVPVDAARVVAGDVGMFMERQALALDAQRALLGGRIQPVGAITGPSFLGWLHPPAARSETASPPTVPGTAR